ncbi:MAG: hypothetical protein RL757_1028 [Bacteroidota bacterium]|jgi:hypothetical protein
MAGETDLSILLKNMLPILNEGDYVFCQLSTQKMPNSDEILMIFKEKEGITLILEKSVAQKYGFDSQHLFAWITLQVHSSLAAVGLTAAFSDALANENVSCNVVAAYFHDHIFVPKVDAKKALNILDNLKFKV